MATKATKASGKVEGKAAEKVGGGGETEIVLQVGSELRISNKGEIILGNPELELAREERAADATLRYRFDAVRGEHILRLVEPVADHKHMKTHRPND